MEVLWSRIDVTDGAIIQLQSMERSATRNRKDKTNHESIDVRNMSEDWRTDIWIDLDVERNEIDR